MILRISQLAGAVQKLWEEGLASGSKTGWPSLDKHYTVAPGQMTILTGWPGAGKSEWLDALLVNLSRQGWKFCVYSPENLPNELHVSKLLEKVIGKPFGFGPSERISLEEISEGMFELEQRFFFLRPAQDSLSVEDILSQANVLFSDDRSDCKRGLVVDPWNELDHYRPPNMNETDYISHCLSAFRNWAREMSVHVWLVAHPQKLRRLDTGKLPVPTPDTISGSQNWWNKADCALTVFREPDAENIVQIYIQKIRFKHIGKTGAVELRYDRVTGRYSEVPKPIGVANYYDRQA